MTIERLTLALVATAAVVRDRDVEALRRSEGAKERDQIALLLAGQFRAEHQIEELNRIIERQQAPVVHVGRRILDAAQREGLDGSVADFIQAVDHLRLEEALGLEIVHQVVGVIGCGVAGIAPALAEEDLLAAQLGLRSLARIELAEQSSFGAGGKPSSSWNSAISPTWLIRSRGFRPFLAAITWSPSKYAPACSNWVKSSMVLSARCEPNSRWICTPRSVGVTTRWRDSCGRASGARCVALLVWPFEWQSKHVAPRLGFSERRSSVSLNCCCGNGVTRRRKPSICLGGRMPLNSP